ncbi:MAG: hypothetical protein NC548_55725 [Lachnospiraceae bacterium]|nr:hypothetical protein [Lachnospiraceae bacterium]
MSKPLIEKIINDDGTEFNPPRNPLLDKYPPKRPNCVSYACIYCGDCPYGDDFRVPEEDMEVYLKWRAEYEAYIRDHNPDLMAWLEEQEAKQKEKGGS